MAEYINKEDFYMKMIRKYDEVADIIEDIESMPTIDIVHCSECKYENGNELYLMCSKTGCEVNPTHFCADGEREE